MRKRPPECFSGVEKITFISLYFDSSVVSVFFELNTSVYSKSSSIILEGIVLSLVKESVSCLLGRDALLSFDSDSSKISLFFHIIKALQNYN